MTYTTYLEHRGILGQKWGVQNGPPYPLGYSDHSAAEKRQMSSAQKRAMQAESDLSKAKKKMQPKNETASSKASKMTDDELKRDNARTAMERQYVKNHQDEDDKSSKAIESARQTVSAASKIADGVEKATRKTVSTSNIDISKLSDKELQQLVSRMNLEAQYNRLTTKEVSNKGAVATREALEVIGSLVAIAGGVVAIKKAL